MTLQLDVQNATRVTGEDFVGKLLTALTNALVARGWTVQGSGDGLSAFQNSGQTAGPYNVFTASPAYATGGGTWLAAQGTANRWSNVRAWIRLREPSPSVREFIFQRGSSTSSGQEANLIVGVAYAGYLAGGASANTVPTSAGVTQILYGAAFNGAGGAWGTAGVTLANTNTIVYNILVSDVAKAGNSWPFFVLAYNSSTATPISAMCFESLSDTISGDTDPVAYIVDIWVNVFGTPNANGTAIGFSSRIDNNATPINTLTNVYFTNIFGSYPLLVPIASTIDSKVRAWPLILTVGTALDGRYKGRCDHLQMNPQARNYPSTLNVTTVTPYIYLGCRLLPWKQNVTPGT
jgi:hypothetical protein